MSRPKARRQIVRSREADAEKRRRVEEILLAGGGAMSDHAIAQTTSTSTQFVSKIRRVLASRLERQLASLRRGRPLTAGQRLLTVNSASNSMSIAPDLEQILAKVTSQGAPIQAIKGAEPVN